MSEFKHDIKEFLAEAEDILAELSSNLLKLEKEIDAGVVEPAVVNSIFRSAHTLKGISGMFGITEMQIITHKMEDILDSLRMGRITINREGVKVLFEIVDLLNEIVLARGKGDTFEMDKIDSAILKLDNVAGASASIVSPYPEEVDIDRDILSVLSEYEEFRLKENIRTGNIILVIGAEFPITVFDAGLVEMTEYLKSIGEVIAILPSASDDKEKLHFDILFGANKDVASINDMLRGRNLTVKVVSGRLITKAAESVERFIPDFQIESKMEEGTLRSVSNTVRVDITKLDNIMNTVGELSQLKTSIAQIVNRLRLETGFAGFAAELSKIDKYLEKRLAELQERMIEVRLVPINQLFDKFVRVVRRFSDEMDKEIELITLGGETELDKLIIEELADPLMHIMRNAIDHGIERPLDREMRGKAKVGIIALRAYQQGSYVVIEVEDDGAGMSAEAIRKKAVEKGLIDVAASNALSKNEILEFIFIPGFSTKDKVSEISGRGVGMDVVKKNLSTLRGTIDIDTEEGRGTKIVLTLPITLAILQALIVVAGDRRYAVPLGSVMEILNIRDSDIKTMEKKEVIVLRDKTIPVLRLEQFFYPTSSAKAKTEMSGIIVGLAESIFCILVGNIIGQEDIVIKPLAKLFEVPGIAGATDLGELGTLLVIDIAGIIDAASKGVNKRAA
ncbi:MAG: hypothetical protein A2022_10490 [Deltaproteobacteria bacterium GWF2_42_12]|nr:MAG: hypothetical protein A2090_07700 [Deltaproteobacteria bacterium GWD2_42_10]OGP46914.1 MAG: hypothetical protein A2022_10490 [Deltaproteobacteria bacterium GWF2_42_12]OGQ23851.1 MAG: hypothetical protein A3D29_01905 [Deltaproteobacteria bacterium RIFCSPHIGHO2_02_FULL_42_44]OGQ68120.1 MAG: hypothetical protein A3F88_01385 [Deltaproteobacteria bacterium RIFCSPLOWO2_12_FULL_42_16]OGQ76380.1 MAG: hypothetical protein A2235_08100 [Deltaproteobacteria bacterium RIFOXYA2_FULL_42_10]